uniref:Uncharacterized protein n=1 Tax=Ditylenchus dipsaci TaxID=166011 RepID=A0A915EFT5_9BILA
MPLATSSHTEEALEESGTSGFLAGQVPICFCFILIPGIFYASYCTATSLTLSHPSSNLFFIQRPSKPSIFNPSFHSRSPKLNNNSKMRSTCTIAVCRLPIETYPSSLTWLSEFSLCPSQAPL